MMTEQLMIMPSEWWPEEETTEAEYVEEVTEEWRLVDEQGKECSFGRRTTISRYSSEQGAKIAATKYTRDYGRKVTPQKGTVTWSD
jgi:HJR/Mrr/RecB family endonuclease